MSTSSKLTILIKFTLSQTCRYVSTSINQQKKFTTYIDKLKVKIKQTKKYLITSLDTEKTFDKIKYPLLIKVMEKLRIQETYLKIIVSNYSKPTANIILNQNSKNFY